MRAARPGQQLLLGAYQALLRQVGGRAGGDAHAARMMLDLVEIDGRARADR